MMQNEFRRIALAQGLLPERLPLREAPTSVEPSANERPEVAEAAGTPAGGWNDDPEMRVASST